ncbi:MAG: hypothetical protein HY553_19155 [Elusimicrobia bacterium]|nr:hypothetical protein [Elusimicrobiota bacterium]
MNELLLVAAVVSALNALSVASLASDYGELGSALGEAGLVVKANRPRVILPPPAPKPPPPPARLAEGTMRRFIQIATYMRNQNCIPPPKAGETKMSGTLIFEEIYNNDGRRFTLQGDGRPDGGMELASIRLTVDDNGTVYSATVDSGGTIIAMTGPWPGRDGESYSVMKEAKFWSEMGPVGHYWPSPDIETDARKKLREFGSYKILDWYSDPCRVKVKMYNSEFNKLAVEGRLVR